MLALKGTIAAVALMMMMMMSESVCACLYLADLVIFKCGSASAALTSLLDSDAAAAEGKILKERPFFFFLLRFFF